MDGTDETTASTPQWPEVPNWMKAALANVPNGAPAIDPLRFLRATLAGGLMAMSRELVLVSPAAAISELFAQLYRRIAEMSEEDAKRFAAEVIPILDRYLSPNRESDDAGDKTGSGD